MVYSVISYEGFLGYEIHFVRKWSWPPYLVAKFLKYSIATTIVRDVESLNLGPTVNILTFMFTLFSFYPVPYNLLSCSGKPLGTKYEAALQKNQNPATILILLNVYFILKLSFYWNLLTTVTLLMLFVQHNLLQQHKQWHNKNNHYTINHRNDLVTPCKYIFKYTSL